MLVHGDDYASGGTYEELQWLKSKLETRFDMKTIIMGHSDKPSVVRESKILNRVVRATKDGWEYESDQRHVEIIVEQLKVSEIKPLSTPGVEDTTDSKNAQALEASVPLSAERTTLYRAIAARANYIAQDRTDIRRE